MVVDIWVFVDDVLHINWLPSVDSECSAMRMQVMAGKPVI